MSASAARDLAESAGLGEHAEREAAKAEASLARVERDYLDGKLPAEKWERLEAKLTDQLDGARAQIEQHDRRRDAIASRIAAIDGEAVVVQELTALRRQIAGEVQDATAGDLNQLRALLRRLFVGFELASPTARFGSGVLSGQRWVESDGREDPLRFDGGYYVIPLLRAEALELEHDDPAGFPAVQRVALSLSDNLCSLLAAW